MRLGRHLTTLKNLACKDTTMKEGGTLCQKSQII